MRNLKWLFCLVSMALALSFSDVRAEDEIAVIPKTLNNAFWLNLVKGVKDKGEEYAKQGKKYNLTFNAPDSEAKLEEQVNMVENAVNRGVKAILLAPSDSNALMPPVRKAREANIPVIILDSPLTDETLYDSFLATDNRAAGEMCANELIKRTGKDGKIVIMSYFAGVGSEVGRVGGFRDTIKKNSNLEIVNTYYCDGEMLKAANQTTDALSSYPDIIGIFGANEPSATGMGRGIASLGKAGKIVAVGFDGDANLQGFVKDGTLQGIAVQSSYNMGYLGLQAALDVIDGKKVDKYIDTGVMFVTKDNIDTQDAKNVLY